MGTNLHIHGETLRIEEVAGLVLSETSYAAGATIPSHVHEGETYFNLVLRGGYAERAGGRVYEVGRSTVVFHPAGELRSNHFGCEPTRLFNVRLDASWLGRLPLGAVTPASSTRFGGGALVGLTMRLYEEFRAMDALSPLAIEGLALELLAGASRGATDEGDGAPGWLWQARDSLHASFRESVRLAPMAEAAGVHPAHLSRTFRRHFGCTVGEYVARLRVEFACGRLAASRAPLAEIAAAAGFADQSHFSRTFKRLTGLTPAAYRALAQPRIGGR